MTTKLYLICDLPDAIFMGEKVNLSFVLQLVCICSYSTPVCVPPHSRLFVFVTLWILLLYDTIFPAVITIDLAVDGDVSSVKLSVPGHGPLVLWGCRHDSPQFLWRVSSFTSGVASGPLACQLSPASATCCINLALLSGDYLCRGYSGSMSSVKKPIAINLMAR